MNPEELKLAGFSDDEITEYTGLRGAGFTDEEINKYYSEKATLPLDISAERKAMVNIPAQTPEQEAGVMPTQTPEEIEANKQTAMRFLWPGAQTAKEHFIKGVTPALGLAGATVAAPIPGGAAPGFAIGQGIGRRIEEFTGVSKPLSVGEEFVEAGKDLAFGTLPWVAGKAAKIPGAIKTGITRGITKAGKVEKVIEKIGGKMLPSAAGESGLKGAQGTLKEVGKVGDELYETAKSLAPKDAKLSMNKTYDTIDRILKDESLNESEKQIARDALERISPSVRTGARGRFSLTEGEAKHIKEAAPEKWVGEAGTITKPISFEEAYTLRRDLSKITKGGGTKAHVAGDILDTLHEELADNASRLGTPEVTKSFQGAVNYWKGTVVPQRTVVKTLEKKSLEKIPDLLNVDIKTVDALKRSMPEESFQDVKRGWLTKISDKAENNPMKIQKSIRDMLAKNKEPMEHAFSPEELSALKLVGEPGKFMAFLEQHPRTKWILEHMVRYGTYGAATGATTLGLAKIFGWGK